MTKIAIIAGNGQLPLLIGKNLINKQFDIFFIGIKGFGDSSLYNKGSAKSFRHINKILNFLFIKFFPISRGNCPSPEIIAILVINIFTNSSFVI